jgi:C-terminal processing protease CtpA/Prc
MAAVADCEALIFDLRSNPGGGPELGHLISSYLFDAPTLLGSYYNRLEDGVKDIYTLEGLPGKRFGQKKPVFVLTSSVTGSGAEAFAFCLQDLKRAVVVGERTVGSAHGARHMAVNDRFWMTIPIVRPISPISKNDWEGTGVTPDIQVPEDQAFNAARNEAAKRKGPSGSITR